MVRATSDAMSSSSDARAISAASVSKDAYIQWLPATSVSIMQVAYINQTTESLTLTGSFSNGELSEMVIDSSVAGKVIIALCPSREAVVAVVRGSNAAGHQCAAIYGGCSMAAIHTVMQQPPRIIAMTIDMVCALAMRMSSDALIAMLLQHKLTTFMQHVVL